MMTMMVLYAGSMMTSLMAVLTSCDTLSGEIASGTIHAIATKPVERWCLVLGKWVGFVGMLTLYVLLIEGGSIVLSWLESGYLPPHGSAVLSLIWLQAVVLLGVTMAASTSFLLAYQRCCLAWALWPGLCRWMDRAVWLFASCAGLRRPGDSLQSHHAQRCPLAPRGLQIPATHCWEPLVFLPSPVPWYRAMRWWSTLLLYAVLAILLAQFLFSRRDL